MHTLLIHACMHAWFVNARYVQVVSGGISVMSGGLMIPPPWYARIMTLRSRETLWLLSRHPVLPQVAALPRQERGAETSYGHAQAPAGAAQERQGLNRGDGHPGVLRYVMHDAAYSWQYCYAASAKVHIYGYILLCTALSVLHKVEMQTWNKQFAHVQS